MRGEPTSRENDSGLVFVFEVVFELFGSDFSHWGRIRLLLDLLEIRHRELGLKGFVPRLPQGFFFQGIQIRCIKIFGNTGGYRVCRAELAVSRWLK
jgi:hypothetical protein